VPAIRGAGGFWSASADLDPFATARRLIQWRDTLAMGGWLGGGKQSRLASLAALSADAPAGMPDRLHAIHDAMARHAVDIESVEMFSPRSDLEPLWQRTLD
jgi:hypothetical protein